MKVVNKAIGKVDGINLVLGKPAYTQDILDKPALVVKILRSPYAYAKIKSINTKRAKALSGVECVLTYNDVPKTRFTLAGQSYPEPSPYDRLILDQYVRYVGDEVAIVAAIDEKTASRAICLIDVKYEVLDPVLDLEDAQSHKSIVHREDDIHLNYDIGFVREKNIAATTVIENGSVEEEFDKCDIIVEDTYYTQAQAHAMMETYRSFTYLDQMGRLNVVSSTQVPFHVKRILARALEIPSEKIRVVKPKIGGGFGGKQTVCVEIFTSLVTLKTGKPAMIIYDRKETFSCTTSRHAMKINVKIGSDKEGNIKAIEMEGLSDTGAYGEHASTVISVAGYKALPLYNKAKAVRFSAKAVYTNKMPGGALRGYGVTQATFALESGINKLASALNMDPAVIREKNIIREGDLNPILDGSKLNSCTLDKCIKRGKELIGWNGKFPRVEIDDNRVRGVGMAITMQGSGIANVDTATVMVRLNDSGRYTLQIGATEMGMGCDTILAQMAAEVLDTSVDNIIVNSVDTDNSPFDTGSYASSTTYVTGNAVIKACKNIKSKILEAGAELLGVTNSSLSFEGGYVRNMDMEKSISVSQIAKEIGEIKNDIELIGVGTFGGNTSPPPFIAGFAEVEVHKDTGKVILIDYVAVVDCGTVINPNLARIQVEGGLVQGIGMAMYEDVVYDKRGKLETNTFMQYKIPCRKDIGNLNVFFEPSYESTGPFGAKSVGEVVINTPPPAIAHAIYSAVGVSINSLPITPEKVLLGIMDKQNTSSDLVLTMPEYSVLCR